MISEFNFFLKVHHTSTAGLEIIGHPKHHIDVERLVSTLTGTQLPIVSYHDVSFQNISIKADIASETAVISAQFGEDNKIVLILQKKSGEGGFDSAVAVEITSAPFSDMVEKVTGLDISDVPYFGTLNIISHIGLIVSTNLIQNNWLKEALSMYPLLSKSEGIIDGGVTAIINARYANSVVFFKMKHNEDELAFEVLGETLTISDLISLLPSVELSTLILPPGVSDISNLAISGFSLFTKTQEVSITLTLPQTLNYFNEFLVISEPTVTVTVSYPDIGLCLAVDSNLTIANLIHLDISIAKEDGIYVLTACTDEVSVANIIEGFNADLFPPILSTVLTRLPLTQVVINNMKMKLPLQGMNLRQIYISGVPSLSGFSLGEVGMLIIKGESQIHAIEAIELPQFNLADFIKKIMPSVSLDSVLIFIDQDIDLNFILSPKALPNFNLDLLGEKFKDISIKKGFSIQTRLPLPDGAICLLNPFCAVVKHLLSVDYLNFQGVIVSQQMFSFIATVDDIRITRGLTLRDAGLEIQVEDGTAAKIGIVGSLVLSSPSLTFTARIYFNTLTSQVALEGIMSGCWEDVLGIRYLDICNLHAFAGFSGVTPTGIGIGGQVRIGDGSCGSVISASGYVGINLLSPTDNYYYANVNSSVTLPALLSAFCISLNLPRPLAETGFPDGYRSSFSIRGKELPYLTPPLTIPPGYHFSGTVNILGLRLYANLTVSIPNGLNGTVELPHLNLANLLRVCRSSDCSRGPNLNILINIPTAQVEIAANCYVSVLGISVQTQLRVTNDKYEFSITGRMLTLFEADLYLSAAYGLFTSAEYSVKGSFKNDLLSQIEDLTKAILQETANIASAAVDEAQNFLDARNGDLENAKDIFRAAQSGLDVAEDVFNAAISEVNRLENRLNSVCRTRSCSSGII